ncbi:hypothetical protein GCM10010336_74300 [Streptomyces goshikiensis]|nr:hypothetical protein GCM10010336_74300 [Streptomyces goshikiensis]
MFSHHPERMPNEESDEILDALTRVMFLGIGHPDRPKLVVMGKTTRRGHRRRPLPGPPAQHLRLGPLGCVRGLNVRLDNHKAPRTR